MQRDAVAFAVEHNGPEAMRADGVRILNYATAVRYDLADGVANSAVRVQIQKHAASGDFILVKYQAAAIAVFVLDYAEREVAVCFLVDADAKYGSVELGGTIEIGNRDVEPNGAVVLAVEVAHDV